ncbi:response regulator [Moritella viscosa]|uniref:Two component transcriptional regulator, winged helix family n=1 Tax=Moritella viscosa TaxID=80854 RepID=A0ABY1HBZ2_9GAMM|nr:response regulator [Moritella viscosa]SGY84273.1 Two component transcriptional regulator, winged helix family [Moritella viscosa]SGY86296.1 Two component transcriptional regulator, winged helix family [Moritella viscosa]SHO24564.1 Two component transcriptional regulator, winged helix family [Moritella viscosa]
MKRQSILVIEDDIGIAESICDYLQQENFNASYESNGLLAEKRILAEQPSLVLLDVMLPGKDGISICRDVRSSYNGYILMFTAKEDDIDQIVGLEVGADDYLIKPIKPRLLLAKIKAFLRRTTSTKADLPIQLIQFGALSIDSLNRKVTLNGIYVYLTSAEFDGLERGIDNRISQLRKKLLDNDQVNPRFKTIRNKGYVLAPGAWGVEAQ